MDDHTSTLCKKAKNVNNFIILYSRNLKRTSFTRGCLVLRFGEISLVVLDKDIFKSRQRIVTVAILSPWKRALPFI